MLEYRITRRGASLLPTAPEAALIAGTGNEFDQNIIGGISPRAAFVNRIDNEVSGRQCYECKYLGHCSKADFSHECDAVIGQEDNGADPAPGRAGRPAGLFSSLPNDLNGYRN